VLYELVELGARLTLNLKCWTERRWLLCRQGGVMREVGRSDVGGCCSRSKLLLQVTK